MVTFSLVSVSFIVVVSFAICVLSTSLAMESTALFVPAFLFVFPTVVPGFPVISSNDAIGLTLVIMFFGQTSTLIGYWYRDQVDRRLARSILWVTVPLAIVGRIVAYLISAELLLGVFSAMLFFLAVFVYLTNSGIDPPVNPTPARLGSWVPSLPAVSVGGLERLPYAVGGLFAGLVGFAVGEVTNTTLTLRRRVPIKRSTGTSTLVLYVTLVAANVTNLVIVFGVPAEVTGGVSVPWAVAVVIAPVVLVGGQVGAFVNNRLPERVVLRMLVLTYVLVSAVTAIRVVW